MAFWTFAEAKVVAPPIVNWGLSLGVVTEKCAEEREQEQEKGEPVQN